MIGEILNAVQQECLQYVQANLMPDGTMATVIQKTNYHASKLPTYSMPFVIIDLVDAPDSQQWLGGVTKMEWNFALNVYNYYPNGYLDDATGTSEDLINIIDSIRQHFSQRQWITAQMPQILSDYGTRFTLSGVDKADQLESPDGLTIGFRIIFDTVSIDDATDSVIESTSNLEFVNQVGSTSINAVNVPYPEIINVPITLSNTQTTIPANTFVQDIALLATQGTPTLRIGTTPDGIDISNDIVLNPFGFVEVDTYFDTDTIIYFTTTGNGIINSRIDVIMNYFNN